MIKLKDLLTEACWKGYKQFGMKKKGKKQVPNCVPVDEEIVTEIGDSSIKPYKFQEVDRAGQFTYVRFTTDSGTEYEVVLEKTTFKDPANKDGYIARAMGIEFLAKKKGAGGYSAKITTNEGDVLKIMSTVTAIIKKYLNKKIYTDAEYIIYYLSKKPGQEAFGNENQRDMLYQRYIKTAIPGSTQIKIPSAPDWIIFKIK
jgi:hypothetical protein